MTVFWFTCIFCNIYFITVFSHSLKMNVNISGIKAFSFGSRSLKKRHIWQKVNKWQQATMTSNDARIPLCNDWCKELTYVFQMFWHSQSLFQQNAWFGPWQPLLGVCANCVEHVDSQLPAAIASSAHQDTYGGAGGPGNGQERCGGCFHLPVVFSRGLLLASPDSADE